MTDSNKTLIKHSSLHPYKIVTNERYQVFICFASLMRYVHVTQWIGGRREVEDKIWESVQRNQFSSQLLWVPTCWYSSGWGQPRRGKGLQGDKWDALCSRPPPNLASHQDHVSCLDFTTCCFPTRHRKHLESHLPLQSKPLGTKERSHWWEEIEQLQPEIFNNSSVWN